MPDSFDLKTNVELGVVPTHIKFVGGLVPDDEGKLPREASGSLSVVAEMKRLVEASPVKLSNAQVPGFPGVDSSDYSEMIGGLRDLGLGAHVILMVGGADPMNPADEDQVAEILVGGAEMAKNEGVEHLSSTSIEEWMKPGAEPKTGPDYEAAVAQNAKLHARVATEAGLAGSCVKNWHIEFLRGGEFQTFTSLQKAWDVTSATNEAFGSTFFKILVDAAHCGDSELSIPENEALIAEIAAAGEMGVFHASAKTTRGCLSTDDGWIGALMTAAAKTGKLEHVFVEVFHHEDPALEGLRELDPGHGIDTTDGRSYSETTIDGVVDVARRLNNLVARGLL
ncbi:MAG: hypothetical protein AAF236_08620 [Verrucomicrobiota bacterium]